MPRLAGPLVLLALAAACDRATDPADTSTSGAAAFAAAAKTVDPSSLTPNPALAGASAECRADGRWIICHTSLVIESVNQPLVDFPAVPCGTIYETSTDSRTGIRWYNAADSVIVKRHVDQSIRGSWSLSPGGSDPTVTLKGSGNWHDADYADPNDLDSGTRASHGELTLRAPGFGTPIHIAGLDAPDGTHHGSFRIPEDTAVAAELCAALTR
jgi:hypothetical protein